MDFLKRLFDGHKRKTPAGTRFCARRRLLTQDEAFLWKSQKNLCGFYRFSTKSITAAGHRGGSGVCRRSGPVPLSVRKDGPPQAEPAAVNVNTVWGRGALSAGPRSFQRRTRSAAGAGPASAPVPNLEKLVAVIRSREVSLTLFYQAQSQCKAIYKDNAETSTRTPS